MPHDPTTDQMLPAAEQQLAELIAKFEPQRQELIKAIRNVLRKRFPTVNELVYDYAKSLVIAYSPNERGIDGIVAMSADAKGVRLFINQGVNLPDPGHLLLGKGRQTRYIHVEESDVLLQPAVESLLAAAVSQATVPIDASHHWELIMKVSKPRSKSQSVKPARPGNKEE